MKVLTIRVTLFVDHMLFQVHGYRNLCCWSQADSMEGCLDENFQLEMKLEPSYRGTEGWIFDSTWCRWSSSEFRTWLCTATKCSSLRRSFVDASFAIGNSLPLINGQLCPESSCCLGVQGRSN